MIRRPPRSTRVRSSAASDVYKRQRRQGIGQTPVAPAGQYHFEPGVEMQHDTSPHEVEVGGKKHRAQTASAVLCYSRLLFFQINPTFQRFDCKVFLTDALRYIGGVAQRVMIDNTHVVVPVSYTHLTLPTILRV